MQHLRSFVGGLLGIFSLFSHFCSFHCQFEIRFAQLFDCKRDCCCTPVDGRMGFVVIAPVTNQQKQQQPTIIISKYLHPNIFTIYSSCICFSPIHVWLLPFHYIKKGKKKYFPPDLMIWHWLALNHVIKWIYVDRWEEEQQQAEEIKIEREKSETDFDRDELRCIINGAFHSSWTVSCSVDFFRVFWSLSLSLSLSFTQYLDWPMFCCVLYVLCIQTQRR